MSKAHKDIGTSFLGTIIWAKIAEYKDAPSPEPEISLNINFGLFENNGAGLKDFLKFSKADICSVVGVKCLSFELVKGERGETIMVVDTSLHSLNYLIVVDS